MQKIEALTYTNVEAGSFNKHWKLQQTLEASTNTEVPRIIVMDGGTLSIDQATLKGLYACDHDWMWDGIEVRNGGHVIMTNEGAIIDAKIGILVDHGSYNVNGNFNPTESNGGGAVNASGDSKFENCRKDVYFANSSVLNSSTFSNTHFLCTDGLKDIQYQAVYTSNQNPPSTSIIQLGTKEFVSMYDIKGISFANSEWSNTRSTSFPAELRGNGISSYDADYQVSSGSSFKDLNFGIQALNATNSTRFIRISGSNQFLRNQIGVRIVGGSLHQIKSGNTFELNPSAFVYNQFFTKNPIIGVSNSGSTKTDVIENTFTGITSFSTSDPLKFGFITDNSNSPNFHLKNNFTKLFMGEQMQRDNTGMQLYCNEHSLFKNSWSAYGKMSNQGNCGIAAPNRLTPDDKFLVPCQTNSLSHINSSASFTYYEYSGFTGNPDPACVTTAVTIGTNCDGFETHGCDFVPPELTSGNVSSYRTQVDGMDEGAFKDVIINSLLRYYYTNGQSEDAEDLFSGLTGDNYKLDYAILLTNSGNYTQADSVINSIPTNSDERSDIEVFMHIVITAKYNNVPLSQLNQSTVDTLIGIADHRSLGGYAAQALLMAYYNQEYLIPIETNQGIGYRSRSDNGLSKESNGSLVFNPSLVDDQLVASIKLNNPTTNAKLIIYNTDGKELFNAKLKDSKTEIRINSDLWPQGLFYGIVTSNDEVVLRTKGMKK
ncbi:MAG: hypothetical protein ABI851_13115 [Saprospiraceae bacterium]